MNVPAIERGNLAVLCLEAGLTQRESAVLMAHYGDGQPKPAVAASLGISLHAVECHLSNAGLKLRREAHRAEWRSRTHEAVQELRRAVQAARSATAFSDDQLTSGRTSV